MIAHRREGCGCALFTSMASFAASKKPKTVSSSIGASGEAAAAATAAVPAKRDAGGGATEPETTNAAWVTREWRPGEKADKVTRGFFQKKKVHLATPGALPGSASAVA